MMPAQFQIDLFDELTSLVGKFEPVVLMSVMQELAGLSRAKGRAGAAARCGLMLCERCTVADNGDPASGSVDEQVINFAVHNGCMVVTNDRRVRDALLDRGVGVISMRKQKRLEIVRR